MIEQTKIEMVEMTRDEMSSSRKIESFKENKMNLMEKAKAKIQREIKILVNISTFKKDNSQRSALNKWFQDSVKNYFLEVFAAPLIMNELGFTSINQVKEYIHQRVVQSEAKFISLILNYYLEIKRFSKLSTFRSNLEDLVLSSLLESYPKAEDSYSSYNRQKNIRKQFVGLLLLIFCDCQENNIVTTSFYDLWNIAYPKDLQYKKKLSRYDLLRGEKTLMKNETNSQQEQVKNTIKQESSSEEDAQNEGNHEQEERVSKSNISCEKNSAQDHEQNCQEVDKKASHQLRKNKRKSRRETATQSDATQYELLPPSKPYETCSWTPKRDTIKSECQELAEEKENLLLETVCLNQVRVRSSCPTLTTTNSTLSSMKVDIHQQSSPQLQKQESEGCQHKKNQKINKKLQIRAEARWGFIQKEISPRIPRSTEINPPNSVKREEFNQYFTNEDSHPRKQLKVIQEQISINQNQDISKDTFNCIQSNITQSPAQKNTDNASLSAYSSSLIENLKQILPMNSVDLSQQNDHNQENPLKFYKNNTNNKLQPIVNTSCSSNYRNQPVNGQQQLLVENHTLSASNLHIRDSSSILPTQINFCNTKNEAQIQYVRQQLFPQQALLLASIPPNQLHRQPNVDVLAHESEHQKFLTKYDPSNVFQHFPNVQYTGGLQANVPSFQPVGCHGQQAIHQHSNGVAFQNNVVFANSFPTENQRQQQIGFQNNPQILACINQAQMNQNNINNLPQQQLQFSQVFFVPFGTQPIQQTPLLFVNNSYLVS